MKRKLLSFPVIIGAILGFLGMPRVKSARQPSREGIEGQRLVEAYDQVARLPQLQALRQLVLRELEHFGPMGTLVDVGSGPGHLLMDIARAHPNLKLIGVEPSADMVELARRNAEREGLGERIEFRAGDAHNLPFEDESVDFVVSSLSLHHWSAPNAGLQEIHRVLKPGGQLLIFDTRRDPRRIFYWGVLFARQFVVPGPLREIEEPTGSILASYTPMEVSSMLEESPFHVRRIRSGPGWIFIWARKDW
ncbi:MAG: class I SAM-dependent methyltransferase [Anaerolineae bacterium]|nr:class I SAM-dependent methyltransferase [Anaerolineae bacterium]